MVTMESPQPAFSFQWNLQFTISKASGALLGFRFWLANYNFTVGREFTVGDADDVRELLEPYYASTTMSNKMTAGPRTSVSLSESADDSGAPMSGRGEGGAGDGDGDGDGREVAPYLFRGWVHLKTGSSYEVCWCPLPLFSFSFSFFCPS